MWRGGKTPGAPFLTKGNYGYAIVLVSDPFYDTDWSHASRWLDIYGYNLSPDQYYKIFYITIKNGLPAYIENVEETFNINIPFKTILQRPLYFPDAKGYYGYYSQEYSTMDADYYGIYHIDEHHKDGANCPESRTYLAELNLEPYNDIVLDLSGKHQLRIFTTRTAVLVESKTDCKITYYNTTSSWIDVQLQREYWYWNNAPVGDPQHRENMTEEGIFSTNHITNWRLFDINKSGWNAPQWNRDKADSEYNPGWPPAPYDVSGTTKNWYPEEDGSYGYYEWHRKIRYYIVTCRQTHENFHETQFDTMNDIDDFYKSTNKPILENTTYEEWPIAYMQDGSWPQEELDNFDYPIDVINLFIKKLRIEKYIDYYKIYIGYGDGAPPTQEEQYDAAGEVYKSGDVKFIEQVTTRNRWDHRSFGMVVKMAFSGELTILEKGAGVSIPETDNEDVLFDFQLNISRLPQQRLLNSTDPRLQMNESGLAVFDELIVEQTIDWPKAVNSNRISTHSLLRKPESEGEE